MVISPRAHKYSSLCHAPDHDGEGEHQCCQQAAQHDHIVIARSHRLRYGVPGSPRHDGELSHAGRDRLVRETAVPDLAVVNDRRDSWPPA